MILDVPSVSSCFLLLMLAGDLAWSSIIDKSDGASRWGRVVGASLRSASGSTMGSEWVGCLLPAGGLLGFLDGLGRRSCIWVWGAVDVMAWMIDGIASTLGSGVMGGLPAWRVGGRLVGWFIGWRIGRLIGGFLCRSLVGRLGGGIRRVQLLATTVSSSSSSLARMWNGSLLRVWRWWMCGMFLMMLGAVILVDVVATLRGGAVAVGTLPKGYVRNVPFPRVP
jgi:hypothetical protein